MAAPTKLGKYLLESVLGKGAMGIVYKAYDPEIRQTVAIKTLHRDQINLDDAECEARLERLKQELIAGRRLKHPNIVALYEYGRDEDTCYIVMELVHGRQLKDYFTEGYPFTLGEIIEIMLQLLEALDYAHRHGVIHRDIKPANIMLTEGRQVQITDFGISKIEDSSLTKTGVILGTPHYMAPEQCLGQHVDARTDIFSAGVVLYQFLTGEKPFVGDSALTIMHRVLSTAPVAPSALNVHIPKVLDDIVQKALAKRPEDRFQSAREFAEALRKVSENLNPPKPVESAIPPGPATIDESAEGETIVLSRPSTSAARPPAGFDPAASGETLALAMSGLAPPPAQPLARPLPRSHKPLLLLGLIGILVLILGLSGAPFIAGFLRQLKSGPEPNGSQTAAEQQALLQARLEALFPGFACARLETRVEGQQRIVQGHVKPEDLSRLEQEIAALPGAEHVVSQVLTLPWPYCEVTEILAPWRQNGDDAMDAGAGQHTRYQAGDNLVLKLTAPGYDAYLYVDYYQVDGGVVHLFPYSPAQHKRYPAGASFTLGEAQKGGKQWEVQAPFGTDLIVILASREPLFDTLRPEVEAARDYLAVLRQALARSALDELAVDQFYITTEERRP